jgi:4-amino-4-deoxy-L-arabinose transferase-like glycosyltransferase
MRQLNVLNRLNRNDLLFALAVMLLGLVVYTHVLAPDVLYSDSGEFQTLAYTWGTTHTTGYPVYLLLARIVGFLPVETLAWRINFASALFAALTLGGMYLVARYFTVRGGALLASLVLLISYTFWSQSVIAEVYTLATALIVLVLLLLLRWRELPVQRGWMVTAVGFVLGAGLGVHMFLLLIAPSVGLFVLWGVFFGTSQERGDWSPLLQLILGGIAGITVFFLLFAYMDTRPTPTNLLTTSIVSSRDVWDLETSDLDTVQERFWINVSGDQWQDRMLPDDVDYQETLLAFFGDDLLREFAIPTLILALIGSLAALLQSRRLFALLFIALLTAFAAGFLYFPGDKYIFYLPLYLLLAIFSGIGAGALLRLVNRLLPVATLKLPVTLILTSLLIAVCVSPFFVSRWRSIQRGYSGFIREDYVYPVTQPDEPRQAAECAVSMVAETDATLVLDWRALYSIYYVAHVEQGRTGLEILQALPYPAQRISPLLSEEITERVQNGEAVYTDDTYPPLNSRFELKPVDGDCTTYQLYKLSLRS